MQTKTMAEKRVGYTNKIKTRIVANIPIYFIIMNNTVIQGRGRTHTHTQTVRRRQVDNDTGRRVVTQ